MNTYSQFNGRSLKFGTLNVCGLKKRLEYPEFLTTISCYDILCIGETKLDSTDVISVPGYTLLSQHRKQKFCRKSGGVGILYKDSLSNKLKLLETNSDYILWIQIDKTLFEIDKDMFPGILYVPPAQSRFLNYDEYFNLESEITSMCAGKGEGSIRGYFCLNILETLNTFVYSFCTYII